jgi:hypothetical protein
MKLLPVGGILAAVLITTLSTRGFSQTTAGEAAPAPSPPAATPDYHPSMGDLMTMAVQPRHIKLGLAGKERNWMYASYELSELRNAFTRIARTIPQYQNTDMASLITAVTDPPLDTLKRAIDARSERQFVRAYQQLTTTCNACHKTLNHAAVVIRVPTAESYPDQEFRPSSPQ